MGGSIMKRMELPPPSFPSSRSGNAQPTGREVVLRSAQTRGILGGLHAAKAAFSLIEVTISLGIMVFVLTGITGLLSGSYNTARDASSDYALTQITRNVVEDLRGRSMDDLIATSGSFTRYFFKEGSPCSAASESAAIQQGAAFKCRVGGAASQDTKSANGDVNLYKVQLHVSWPVMGSGTREPNAKDIFANVARY